MLKTYAVFLYPGFVVSETSSQLVRPGQVAKTTKGKVWFIYPKLKWPKGAFGVSFHDREEREVDGEMLYGKEKNHSHFFYQGRRMSLEDVKREFPQQDILIGNMERNNIPFIVYTKAGQAIPLKDGDSIVEPINRAPKKKVKVGKK